MTEQLPPPAAANSGPARNAGMLALALPVLWAVIVALELGRAGLSHSLVSRPERLFGSGNDIAAWLACGLFLSQLLVLRIQTGRADHRRIARLALAVATIATLGRLAVSTFGLVDPNLYQVSQLRGLGAILFLACLPAAVTLVGVALSSRDAALRWLSAAVAIAMVWVAVWATIWSARSGALQPQLWAVEPVEGLGVFWVAAVGVWLLGWPAAVRAAVGPRIRTGPRLPAMPSPGRKASIVLVLVGAIGVVAVSADYIPAVSPAIAAQLTGRTQVETIRVGDPGLVIVLHGVFGSGFQAESSTGFDAQADRLGWIVAYPDGVLDGWDAFGDTPYWGRHPGADDVAFIAAVVDHLESADHLSPDRVYITGFSRGAMMTYRLGCELSGRVAAIAPVSGNMATADGSAADVPCRLSAPVSVLAIHGTADGSIPIAGGRGDIDYAPMADVIARWRTLDSCGATAAVSTDGPSTTTTWACGSATVETRIVNGGAHAWPGAVAPPNATSVDADAFDASRLIADFFVAHPRPRLGE
jgi:polyhydroxybutyrate depolymerase